MRVSDSVKKILQNGKINKNYDLSTTEKEFLSHFFDQSEAKISKSKKKVCMIFDELWERLSVLLGEMQAGNTSVKNEATDIAHYLYKNKQMDKSHYQKLLSLI